MESWWTTDIHHGWGVTTQPLNASLAELRPPPHHLEWLARNMGGHLEERCGTWKLVFPPGSIVVRENRRITCACIWVTPTLRGFTTRVALASPERSWECRSECSSIPQLFQAVYVSLSPACECTEENTPWSRTAQMTEPPPEVGAPWDEQLTV